MLLEDDVIKVNSSQYFFNHGVDPGFVERFCSQSLEDAKDGLKRYLSSPTQSCFQSIVMSVRKVDYEAFIKNMKTELLRMQAKMESDEADMLVRFNVQIYPCDLNK